MQCNPFALQAVPTGSHNISNPVVERVCEWNVGNHSLLKECPWPETLGAVNYLVRHHKVSGLNFLPQATDGRECNNGTDTDGTQGGDIGTGGDFMWRQLMVKTMTTEECNSNKLAGGRALVVKDSNRGRGVTPRCRDRQRSNLGEARQLTKSCTADNSNADGVCIPQDSRLVSHLQ